MLKLRLLLPLLLVVVAALPSGIVSSVLLQRVYTVSSDMKQRELSRALDSVVESVNSKLAILSTGFQMFSEDRTLLQAIERIAFATEAQRTMNTFVKRTPLLKSVYLLSPDLNVIDTYNGSLSVLEHSGARILLQKAVAANQLNDNRQWFFEIRHPAQVTGERPDIDNTTTDYAIAIATPLFLHDSDTRQTTPAGYLLGVIPLSVLKSSIINHLEPDEAIEMLANNELRFDYEEQVSVPTLKEATDTFLVSRDLVLRTPYTDNDLRYSLRLYVPRWSRMEEVNDTQQALTHFILLLTLCALVVAYLLTRKAMAPFGALSEIIDAYQKGHYEYRARPMIFQEYEQIRALLENMGQTIQHQLSTLHHKNTELMDLARLKDEYLHRLTHLNDRLEQKVSEQTRELTSSLERVEESKAILQRLLNSSIQLQASTTLTELPQMVLQQLAFLVPGRGYAVYVRAALRPQPVLLHEHLTPPQRRWLERQLKQLPATDANKHIRLEHDDPDQAMQLFTLRANQYFGVIIVAAPTINSELTGILSLFAKLTGSIAANHLLTDELRLTARTDELTRLGNRKAFEEELTELILEYRRYPDEHVGLLMIDANDLKKANDCYGHEVGDLLLTELSKVLMESSRRTDKVFRIGGDEFAILVRRGTDESCQELASRLIQCQQDRFFQTLTDDGQQVQLKLSFSIGTASTEQSEPEQLFKTADQAMYEAKQRHHEAQRL